MKCKSIYLIFRLSYQRESNHIKMSVKLLTKSLNRSGSHLQVECLKFLTIIRLVVLMLLKNSQVENSVTESIDNLEGVFNYTKSRRLLTASRLSDVCDNFLIV